MDIRDAREGDIDEIKTVAKRSWEDSYSHMLHEETITDTVEDWYCEERLISEMSLEDGIFIVAEDDEDVIGFLHGVYDRERHEGHILRVYVDPENRRSGVGKELFEEARDMMWRRGAENLRGTAFKQNDVGNSFYEEIGFEKTDEGTVEIDDEEYDENVYELEI